MLDRERGALNLCLGPVLYDLLYSLLGSGVFNSDGEMWK